VDDVLPNTDPIVSLSVSWICRHGLSCPQPQFREADVDKRPFGRFRLIELLGDGGFGDLTGPR
jgi:hypothetical protein